METIEGLPQNAKKGCRYINIVKNEQLLQEKGIVVEEREILWYYWNELHKNREIIMVALYKKLWKMLAAKKKSKSHWLRNCFWHNDKIMMWWKGKLYYSKQDV